MVLFPEQVDRCQQCNRVGHLKDPCFDINSCENGGKINHHTNRCSKKRTTAREKVNFIWISSCDWMKTTKKIYKSYQRICSRVMTNLVVMKSTSHPVFDKELLMVCYKFEFKMSSESESKFS